VKFGVEEDIDILWRIRGNWQYTIGEVLGQFVPEGPFEQLSEEGYSSLDMQIEVFF
jgi:hypothetical protein